ncbi:NADP-dependent oxidoreductase, partial [Nocardioides hankookensis]
MSEVVVHRLPDGVPTPDDFDVVESTTGALADGQVRIAVRTLSLDPYAR